MPSPADIVRMQRALMLAATAARAGEVPVGALVTLGDDIIGEGWNQPISAADPCAHAEIIALRAAAQRMGNYRLPECELYVTLEPCTMCIGAIVHARIKRLVFAATEPKAGVVISNGNLLEAGYLNHKVLWESGVCAEQSAEILQRFFQDRREAKRKKKNPIAPPNNTTLSINNGDHLAEFIRLNEEWIATYFAMEPIDLALAKQPGQIIDKGGFIFSLEEAGEVVGVCALFKIAGDQFELARMAVAPKVQGKGYGKRLLEAALSTAKNAGATQVRLLSNTKLETAIALYKKFGFQVTAMGQHPDYKRCNIVMDISLI